VQHAEQILQHVADADRCSDVVSVAITTAAAVGARALA